MKPPENINQMSTIVKIYPLPFIVLGKGMDLKGEEIGYKEKNIFLKIEMKIWRVPLKSPLKRQKREGQKV